jgi:hypothetical protein
VYYKCTWIVDLPIDKYKCMRRRGIFVNGIPEFSKLHMGLVVLVKKMSVLINFLLQNTNLVSVLSKICPNFAGHV